MTTENKYTEQQSAAITTHDASIALDAGAGCGKTFVLTERFLSHLAPVGKALELSELVAITFTDAAAREMRERVRSKCHDRLRNAPPDEAPHWLRLLRMLDAARVSTIHAFCSTVVRSHALELGLDPGFAVLDQPAADVLLSEVTDARLREALEGRDPDVRALAAEYGLGGLKSRLAPFREQVGGRAYAEWANRSVGDVVDGWRTYFETELAPVEREQVEQAPEIAEIRRLIPQCTGDAETRGKLAELDELLQQVEQGGADDRVFAEVREHAKVVGVCNKKTDWPSPEIKSEYTQACKGLRDKIDKLPSWQDDPALHEAAALGQRLARVAAQVEHAYQAAKADAAALDFEDLLKLAQRLLTAPEHREAQRRLRASIRLLLVDEFQDTDRVQTEIVSSLVGENLGGGRLFFVGDFKQSIYRFRGAEPRVFRDLQDRIPEKGRLPLSRNFRSQPGVIDFVNALFEPLFGEGYSRLEAHRDRIGDGPSVQFLWATPPGEKPNAEDLRKAEARRIAQHIQQLLSDPTPRVPDEQRGKGATRAVQPGDIVILFRALSDVQHYEQALRDAGIDHHLIGGHAFYSQQEVFDLLNLLRTVSSECDEVSLAGVLRSPFFALQDETLLWLARAGGSLNAGLLRKSTIEQLSEAQQSRVDRARSVLSELRAMRGVANTAELIRVALERTGYDAGLAADYLGERKQANLRKVVEQARAADRTRPGDIDAFVRQLTEFIARQPKEALAATAEEKSTVVRLMTVHHAKGLEFPVVFVADLSRRLQADTSQSAFDPRLGPLANPNDTPDGALTGLKLYRREQSQQEKAESVRLFYVACTRAADLLVLSAAVEDIEKPRGEWLTRLNEVFHLQTGATRASGDTGLVEVVPTASSDTSGTSTSRKPNLLKLINLAQEQSAGAMPLPAAAMPLLILPQDLQRFSVSRLSGKLHYRAEQHGELRDMTTRDELDPLKFGTLVHAVLERVDFANPTRLGEWCQALAPLHMRRNWNAAATEAESLVAGFLKSDRCTALRQANQVRREIEFVMQWPIAGDGSTAVLQGYIDCLYLDQQGGWRLLDYKTNRVAAAGVTLEAEAYRLQMAVYALAIEQSLGVRPVALDVHFLRADAEASFEWDDDAREAAIKSINQTINQVRREAVQHA